MSEKPICLIERAGMFDGEARATIAMLYCPIVYRWARRWGVSRKDAPQVTRRALRTTFKQIKSYRFSDQGLLFRSTLWSQARYHASDNPSVNSMSIPDRYPGDVPAGIVADDTRRLLRSAGSVLLNRFPSEQHVVFHHLIDQRQTPRDAAARLPFSLREIRELRNKYLRRLYAEFGQAIGLI